MINLIYILFVLIFLFLIFLIAKAIGRGVEAKKNFNQVKQKNLIIEISKLKKLLNDGTLTQEEFKKAKKKILRN